MVVGDILDAWCAGRPELCASSAAKRGPRAPSQEGCPQLSESHSFSSDGALSRCYLLIPGDLNNALQLCFQTPSRPRRTAIIFRQLGSADYDLGRRPAPSREESVSLLAIPEWRLHPHIFQESAAALPVQNLNRHDGARNYDPSSG